MPHSLSQRRLAVLALLAVALGAIAAPVSWILTRLIGLVIHLMYFGTLDTTLVSPAEHQLGLWAV